MWDGKSVPALHLKFIAKEDANKKSTRENYFFVCF